MSDPNDDLPWAGVEVESGDWRPIDQTSDTAKNRTTTPFVGPHGSYWVVCEECDGRGVFPERDCGDDEWCDESEPNECDRCHGNGGYWDCVDDLCASLIDEWNE